MTSFIQNLAEISKKAVAIAGGKGASLGEMTQAGLPIPRGFVVLAPAFDRFLKTTNLEPELRAELNRVNYDDLSSVERVSRVIRDVIHGARFPKDLAEDILTAHKELGSKFVAVRSSATVEDSSVASWAGELETHLNATEKTLLGDVKRCWSSLFTPRAIVYRDEKGLRDTHVSVAVVVQKMAEADVSGVTFTVHPVSKDPHSMIIEACWGLGGMLVDGMMTPDSYVIDKRDGSFIDIDVHEQKRMLTRGVSGTKTVSVPSPKRSRQKLDDAQIRELVALCMKIEAHYGFPCDIEWCFERGKFFVVQSRPITTL